MCSHWCPFIGRHEWHRNTDCSKAGLVSNEDSKSLQRLSLQVAHRGSHWKWRRNSALLIFYFMVGFLITCGPSCPSVEPFVWLHPHKLLNKQTNHYLFIVILFLNFKTGTCVILLKWCSQGLLATHITVTPTGVLMEKKNQFGSCIFLIMHNFYVFSQTFSIYKITFK